MRTQYSYSFVNLFNQCSMKWYLRYNIKPDIDEDLRARNPLYLGILLEGLVKEENAIDEYYMKYPIIQDDHINEVIKAEYYAKQIKDKIVNPIFEYKLESDDFIGYIDCLELNSDGSYTLTDFKYSNYKDNYIKSMQLHLYKYYFEKITGNKVNKLQYIIAPKILPRKDYVEGILDYRRRLYSKLSEKSIEIIPVKYDHSKVDEYFKIIDKINHPDTKIEKNIDNHCGYCEYSNICLNQEVK